MQLTMGHLNVKHPAASDGWARLLEAVKLAAALITPKELAYGLDVQPSYLSDAMRGVDRKSLKMEWLPTIVVMAPEQSVDAILMALAGLRGRIVERRKQLTADEELAAYRAAVKRMAPAVDVLATKEIEL
jgi:hypothetical protein